MIPPTPDDNLDPVQPAGDAAVSRRLRQLGAVPVDLTRLDAALRAELPRETAPPLPPRRRWYRPALAVAASLAAMLLVGALVVNLTARPVLASTDVLESLYSADGNHVTTDNSHGPMACCIQKVGGKPVTCLTLDVGGKRVSMAVAEAKHFRVPDDAGRKVVDGVEYRHQSAGPLNMVMAVRGDAWVCLMGEVSIDDLIAEMAKAPTTPR